MTKKLDEHSVLNELHGESAFFSSSPASQGTKRAEAAKPKSAEGKKRTASANTDRQKTPPQEQPGEVSAHQPVDQSTKESTAHAFDRSPIVPRPKSFYITEQQDEDLDVLVKMLARRLEGKIGHKIDRSTVTRLIFEDIGLAQEETAKRLATRLTSRLVSQLTS